jgi:hypothetical protein
MWQVKFQLLSKFTRYSLAFSAKLFIICSFVFSNSVFEDRQLEERRESGLLREDFDSPLLTGKLHQFDVQKNKQIND